MLRKVVIIEDEPLSAQRLRKKLLNIDDTLTIDGPLRSVAEVENYMQANTDYDLMLADIRLLDGDVFEAFRRVPPASFVIFTTAYDEYAMQAIKSHGIDYLLKPIDEDELREALHKVELAPSNRPQVEAVTASGKRYRERILVYKGEDMLPLAVADILYFLREGKTTRVVAATGETYIITTALQELEPQLNPQAFFRLNRQYLINIRALTKVRPFYNSKLIVTLKHCTDEHIYVSRDRAQQFKEWLNQ